MAAIDTAPVSLRFEPLIVINTCEIHVAIIITRYIYEKPKQTSVALSKD
jgi:hypothetical protein